MASPSSRKSGDLDDLDRRIIHALQINPRAGFHRVAAVLGVSEQTVARRYQRLRGDGLFRVIGLVDPRSIGQTEWMVRVGCRPGGVAPLADALARRDDVSWVVLSAGGSEIVCSVRSRSPQQRDDLLLQRLPATSQVLSITAHAVMHRFLGGAATDWLGYGDALSPGEIAALRPPALAAPSGLSGSSEPGSAGPSEQGPSAQLRPEDGPLLDELARDGRCSYAALAAAAGWSVGRVTRRLEALRSAGIVYFDVDLAVELMGFGATGYLWLTVEPASLAAVGEELARHAEIPFAAAISGSANLVAAVLCRDTEALYQYVTTKISATAGLRQLEISPILRRVKQAGSSMAGPRLASPAPAARPRRRTPASA
jgi:DNA-binding Lrp family transcriptional regulator